MGNAKMNAKASAKKALAVFSAAALLLSGSATGAITILSDTGITANAATTTASATATQLKIYDENGKDISNNPIIYLDNSRAARGITSRSIKVVASNEQGQTVNDKISCYTESGATDYIRITGPSSATGTLSSTLEGGYWDTSGTTQKWVSKKSGTTYLNFTTESGEVFRRVTVVVYNPATDMKIAQGSTTLDLNDYNESNAVGLMTIANHKYQFTATKVPSNSTDEVEWYVYEGGTYNGTGTPQNTNKAEITPEGLFTAKTNGMVTIVAKYKPTETSARTVFYGTKKIKYIDSDGKEQNETLEDFLNGPKYIHVQIVKENPAKELKITNAPSALEINDEFQLDIKATPTYTGSGYESGATDVYTWESSNPKVVTVDDKGLVKAVGKGDAKITIYGENENVRAECDIKVLTKATSIKFDVQGISTRVGVDATLTATMNPTTADEEIIWTSSDESIATVKSIVNGAYTNQQSAVITGVKKGTVTITARARNSGVESKITCNVAEKINSADISLSTQDGNTITTINQGSVIKVFDQKTITINGILTAADGKTTPDNDTIKWELIGNGANNDAYVAVNSQNSKAITLTGFARGSIQVKASSAANPSITKTFTLQVLKKAEQGSIISTQTGTTNFNKALNVGSTLSLGANITIDSNQPYDHDDSIVKWTSNNESVATVDNNGYVKVVGNGTATISFVTASGFSLSTPITGFTTSSIKINNVTITAGEDLPITSIDLGRTMTGTKTLSATIKNEKNANQTGAAVTWSSDNEAVATVDSTGKITAYAIGEAVITAKSGNKTDSCKVYVNYPLNTNATANLGTVYYTPYVTSYEPEVEVVGSDGRVLTKDKDYVLEYTNNTGITYSAKVTATGIGRYTGSISKNFSILARPVNDPEVTISAISAQELTSANKSVGVQPEVTVKHQGYTLVKDKDYTVTYSNNRAVSTTGSSAIPTVTIAGIGNYGGRATAQFTIYCNHKTTTETVRKQPTYTETGEKVITCTVCGHTDTAVIPMLTKTPIKNCTVTLNKTSFIANGNVQVPTVTVKNGSTVLRENTDYTLKYSNNSSITAGKYSVTITGAGGYTGSVIANYTITVNVTSVKVSKASATLGIGESLTIKATVTPSAAVTWSSSNTNVATVVNGKITAKKAGTAVITAKAGSKSATCKITVKNAPTKITLDKTSLTLGAKETYTLKKTLPSGSASNTVTFTSSNSSVATVSSTGKIVTKKAGTATITVKTYNGKTATCKVTVKNAPTKITLSKTSATIGVKKTLTLKTTLPSGTASNKLTYKSSNTSVATVSSTGTITAKKVGTATITVTTFNGKKATCKVTVKNLPTSVKLNKTSASLKKGGTLTLKATVSPSSNVISTVTWTSSNTKIATVKNGKVTAKAKGTVTITVKTTNGKTAKCKITIK